jgi:hypothetical protein
MDNINESWKMINGYANYEISSFGRVRNIKTSRVLKPGIETAGYSYVILCVKGVKRKYSIHRLTAGEFIDNVENKPFIDHIDNDKLNNNIVNLRWASKSENQWNKSKQNNTSSIYKGVCMNKSAGKWVAQIKINGFIKYLGCFINEKDAANKYNEIAEINFGEFAKLNKFSQ